MNVMKYLGVFFLILVSVILVLRIMDQYNISKTMSVFEETTLYGAIAFKYPKDWKIVHDLEKQKYYQVMIQGPRNPENTYSCLMFVMIQPAKSRGGRYTDVNEMIESRNRNIGKKSNVLWDRKIAFDGANGRETNISFIDPGLPGREVKSLPVDAMERVSYLERDGLHFQIGYSADKKQFALYEKGFERLKKAFKLG